MNAHALILRPHIFTMEELHRDLRPYIESLCKKPETAEVAYSLSRGVGNSCIIVHCRAISSKENLFAIARGTIDENYPASISNALRNECGQAPSAHVFSASPTEAVLYSGEAQCGPQPLDWWSEVERGTVEEIIAIPELPITTLAKVLLSGEVPEKLLQAVKEPETEWVAIAGALPRVVSELTW